MTGHLNLKLAIVPAVLLALVCTAGALLHFRPVPPSRQAIAAPEVMKAGVFDPAYAAHDFSLRGSDGSNVTLAGYRGKVVLLTFGYTHCTAVCPTTLATLAQARNQLGKAADKVQVVYVTVDPERDDAGRMRTYLALAAVRNAYGVTAVKQGNGPDYAMAHTSSIFLIDPAGKLRALMPFGHGPADFVHDIELLLAD
jgi:protein SCO1/2